VASPKSNTAEEQKENAMAKRAKFKAVRDLVGNVVQNIAVTALLVAFVSWLFVPFHQFEIIANVAGFFLVPCLFIMTALRIINFNLDEPPWA
jgi:hypothetical protein